MQLCYDDAAEFNDPVFRGLDATEARAMWEMFCVKSKDLKIEFTNITANESEGSAEWTANYTFSSTGKPVKNHIMARFGFENGKIAKHTDSFNFYNWARQALGLPGVLLGWLPFLKSKVQKTGSLSLNQYIERRNKLN